MKMHLVALVGLAISFAVPAIAQEQSTVDPEVRQQIEALIVNLDEAYNKSDAPAVAALFAQDAVEVWYGQPEGGLASGQQAIEKRYAGELGPGPHHLSHKLLQAYPVGSDICAIMEWSLPPMDAIGHDCVAIFGRDADTWKIRVFYPNWTGRETMKLRLLPTLVGLAIGFAATALAEEQSTVNPEVRQQIEAELAKFDDAFNIRQ